MKTFFEALGAACLMGLCIVLRPVFRPWYSHWGTTPAERTMQLSGDELVPEPRGGYTQAITINAPAEAVWPWIAQVGQGKGGFYSYEVLENLVGCNIHNVERILPKFQDVKQGDAIVMHPKMPGIPIATVEKPTLLVAGGAQDEFSGNNWIFFIRELDGVSRLITRWFFQYKPSFLAKLGYNWFLEPIASVMQRKMLKTIKRLAETKVR